MAVPTSSYCKALPAYLHNFCALVKSSGESWTPPAEGGEEDHQNDLSQVGILEHQLRSHAQTYNPITSNICSPDLHQQHFYLHRHSKLLLACSC